MVRGGGGAGGEFYGGSGAQPPYQLVVLLRERAVPTGSWLLSTVSDNQQKETLMITLPKTPVTARSLFRMSNYSRLKPPLRTHYRNGRDVHQFQLSLYRN